MMMSRRYELLLGYFDDLAAAVRAAVTAGAMAHRRLTAFWARDHVRRGEGVVRAALVALRVGGLSLRDNHARSFGTAVGPEASGTGAV
jgi:hypothetical protein